MPVLVRATTHASTGSHSILGTATLASRMRTRGLAPDPPRFGLVLRGLQLEPCLVWRARSDRVVAPEQAPNLLAVGRDPCAASSTIAYARDHDGVKKLGPVVAEQAVRTRRRHVVVYGAPLKERAAYFGVGRFKHFTWPHRAYPVTMLTWPRALVSFLILMMLDHSGCTALDP
jgi:hypothetical protein